MSNHCNCSACQFQNPELSIYCQHCGKKLKKKLFGNRMKASSNPIHLAGMGQKGSSMAPLGGMAIEGQTKQFSDYKYSKTFPKIKVSPLPDGTWFCPLCGDKNKGVLCRGCGFPKSQEGVS